MSHGGLRSVACEACRAFCAVATVMCTGEAFFFTISALRAYNASREIAQIPYSLAVKSLGGLENPILF
jgi:hypothetical protein